jgi:hypothetical protein
MKQRYPAIEGGRFHEMIAGLRRVASGKSDEDPVAIVDKRFCEGCDRPECDHGCAYGTRSKPKEEPMTHIVQKALTIHEPIETFAAPAPPVTISDAFRRSGQDVATAIDHMIATCEEARQEGLKLIEALNESGQWHDEFLTNYVTVQTKAAGVMRDAWKGQIEELRRQRAALAQSAPQPTTQPEGEQS